MHVLQAGLPGTDALAVAVRVVGHLLACLVAAAVAEGAAGRWLRPFRVVVAASALAVVVPAVGVGALRLGLLGPVVDVTGWGAIESYGVLAGAVGVSGVVLGSAAADAELSDPGYPNAASAFRAHLSGEDLTGVVAGTVALVAGEVATVTVVNAL